MTILDYGPIPVSRLKDETTAIFEALSDGQRVLVSRHGRVVAAVEPVSVASHSTQLARFAAASTSAQVRDLSATNFGQGSPSQYIRLAESGTSSLVTKNGKVYGVLSAPDGGADLASVDERERALTQFEHDHPDAAPVEIATFTANWEQSQRAVTGARGEREMILGSSVSDVQVSDAELDVRLLTEALLVRGIAQERTEETGEAVRTFETVIHRFKDVSDPVVRRGVNRSMMELAKMYANQDRPHDAVSLTQEIEARVTNCTPSVLASEAWAPSAGAT